jgi:hypothetical protein
MTADEKQLREYLDEQNVYKDNSDMQTIVINSFYNQCEEDNDDKREEKVAFAILNFDVLRLHR